MRTLLVLATAVTLTVACKKADDKKVDPAPAAPTTAPKTAEPPATPPATDPPKPADPAMAAPATPTPPPAAGPRPASITEAHVAVADKLVALLQEFGKALDAAGTDCKAATAVAKKFDGKFKAVATEAEKVKEATDKDPAAEEWFKANYMSKMMEAMAPLMKVAQACSSDKEFMATMKSMEMPGRKVKKAGP